MSQAEVPLAIGETVDGRYRIVSQGAAGGCWQTYVAYDGQQDRLVVLVVLARRLGTEVSLLERVARANQAVLAVDGPGLVPYERAGLTHVGGQFYLVRRHLEGTSLRHLLDQAGPMEPNIAVSLTVRLCEALAPLHRAGLVHGGLSPHTIWIGAGEDAPVWLVDCGLLPALGPAIAGSNRSLARFPYLAPEQGADLELHPSADVYAVGLLLYEALAGKSPFPAGRPGEPDGWPEPVPLETRVPQVPRFLAQTVQVALSKEPSSRYRSAGQLAHLLRTQLEAPPAGPGSTATGEPAAAQMVVPAPIWRAQPRRDESVYYPAIEQEQWADEPARVDWLLLALVIAALVAVLGLIPLWRVVQRRYTPVPVVPAGAMVAPRVCRIVTGMPAWAMAAPGLENPGSIWYNLPVEAERERELEKFGRLRPHSVGSGDAVYVDLSVRYPPARQTPV